MEGKAKVVWVIDQACENGRVRREVERLYKRTPPMTKKYPEHSGKFSRHVPHSAIILHQTHCVSVVSVAVFALQSYCRCSPI